MIEATARLNGDLNAAAFGKRESIRHFTPAALVLITRFFLGRSWMRVWAGRSRNVNTNVLMKLARLRPVLR